MPIDGVSSRSVRSGRSQRAEAGDLGQFRNKPYAREIEAAARKYNLPPKLLAALIQQESGFNPGARSPAGASGLTQLMPATARSLGVSNPMDPKQAIEGGAKYLKQQLDAFGGNVQKALAAYNAGPGNVQKYGGIPPFAETQKYVRNVMSMYDGSKSVPTGGGASTASAGGGMAGGVGGAGGAAGSSAAGGAPIGDMASGPDPLVMMSLALLDRYSVSELQALAAMYGMSLTELMNNPSVIKQLLKRKVTPDQFEAPKKKPVVLDPEPRVAASSPTSSDGPSVTASTEAAGAGTGGSEASSQASATSDAPPADVGSSEVSSAPSDTPPADTGAGGGAPSSEAPAPS